MEGLFPRQAFADFGPCRFSPVSDSPALHRVRGRRPAELRRKVRQHCPRLPGVYGMIDANGQLAYVGKAKDLRARLLCYFRLNSRDPKAGRIIQQTRVLAWEPASSEFAALLRELELIRRWQPRLNVQGQPRRGRRTYVCLGRRPAPHVFLSTRPPSAALACYGPVPAGQRVQEAVRRLNDWCGLRDCPQKQEMVFADQGELFPVLRAAGCLRHEIGSCLAPCAAACTRRQYADRVRAARAFLDGNDAAPLEVLEREMTAAAAALQYERAAALRDRLDALRWLYDRLGFLRRARKRQSFVYPVQGHDGSETWYLIHHGQVRVALPAPQSDDKRRSAEELVQKVFRDAAGRPGPVAADEMDGVLLVAAWFRRHPVERARVLTGERRASAP